MLSTNDVAKVYDTILSIPGMNEIVKIDLKISRKNVLLLNSVIERGLTAKDDDKSSNLPNSVPEESFGYDIMRIAKISVPATYHMCVKALSEYGYIRYVPSFKRNQGNRIYFPETENK